MTWNQARHFLTDNIGAILTLILGVGALLLLIWFVLKVLELL